MKLFSYSKQSDLDKAVGDASRAKTAQIGADIRFLAGGTTLVDLMKLNVERPEQLLDISKLPLDKIETTADGGLKIGAMVRNSDLAQHPYVTSHFRVLHEAILSGASPQLRNKASTGGNILQKTRCIYFRDTAYPCNKREPGSGCPAITGDHRNLAILGTSDSCVANNPSDMCVAMMALEAIIHVKGKNGERKIAFDDFYTLPGDKPHIENVLEPGDLITHVSISKIDDGSKSLYLKLRDRASYEFALASAAIIMKRTENRIDKVRIAMGGIGAKPWRGYDAEKILEGQSANPEVFLRAAEALLKPARPLPENKFKVELAKRCLVHALKQSVASV